MKINIFGSTGVIGTKTLSIIKKYFPSIKVNLLSANKNYNLLIKQAKIFQPKYVSLNDISKLDFLRDKLHSNIQILSSKDLKNYLINSNSELSLLAISGYKSLNNLEQIINNTNYLGLVSKEAIVSAGHIFVKKNYFNKTNIIPIDSEHFSIHEILKNNILTNDINKIYLTASGGPFYKKKFTDLKKVSFNEAIKHPKWKMGYKNSIDSATLVNKCLEIVEAHYLFNIPYNKIEAIIHPEAIVHSIIEKNNFVSHMNLFKNDMSIPLWNFLSQSTNKKNKISNEKFFYKRYENFSFHKINNEVFPVYKYFNKLDKEDPKNIIKFNIGNEFAVDLFKKNLIKYTDIYNIIKKVVSLNLYSELNSIKDVIQYHEELEQQIFKKFQNFY